MILRLWRGWTAPENADRYEELIRTAIFPGILARSIAGLEGLELFRRPLEAEVESMTLMRFTSWDAVKAFAGPNWEVSVVPPAARATLSRFDEKATHYDRRVTQEGPLTPQMVGERHSETRRKRGPRQRFARVEKNGSVFLICEHSGNRSRKSSTRVVRQLNSTAHSRSEDRDQPNRMVLPLRVASVR
jgi:hypothetical protein